MNRPLDPLLEGLREELLKMAGLAEAAVKAATDGWRLRSQSKLNEVYVIESRVNQAQMAVDSLCLKMLATQTPLANDLRIIIASIKINTDLERMVDLAVNIGKNTEYYLKADPIGHLVDLAEMSDEVCDMMKRALDSFVRLSEPMARDVLLQDDKVDAFKNKIFRDVLDHVKADRTTIEQGLNVILIARNLERIGDHATNIAEDVIFSITGQDIRHPRENFSKGHTP